VQKGMDGYSNFHGMVKSGPLPKSMEL